MVAAKEDNKIFAPDEWEKNGAAVTIKTAALKLGVSVRTVWRMIGDGQLRVTRLRRCTRVLRESVLDCLNLPKGA